MPAPPPELSQLAEFAAALRWESLSPAVVSKAALVILDTVGAVLGGSVVPELATLAAGLAGPGPASLLGGGRRVAPGDAGLWNGTAGSVLELYEGSRFTRAPTAIQFLPAAIAEAERRGARGSELLVALVAGYEVASRLARAWHLKDLHHPSGTWGVMGAAAAVGVLRGASGGRLVTLIDLAASLCLTTSLDTVREGATIRNAYAGVSNLLGTLACDLQEAGFTPLAGGVRRIYGELLCDRFDPAVLRERLGTPYEIERGYFKRHACYRHAHAALDALDAILTKEHRAPEAVQAIRVQTYDFAARLTNSNPQTTLAAQFSIPHALAARYVLGHAGPEAFAEASLDDPGIARLRSVVRVIERPEHTAMQPDRRPATVELVLTDGGVLAETVELPRGEPENPLSQGELEAKFVGLAGRRLGEAPARALCGTLLAIGHAPDVRPVFSAAIGESRSGSARAS